TKCGSARWTKTISLSPSRDPCKKRAKIRFKRGGSPWPKKRSNLHRAAQRRIPIQSRVFRDISVDVGRDLRSERRRAPRRHVDVRGEKLACGRQNLPFARRCLFCHHVQHVELLF